MPYKSLVLPFQTSHIPSCCPIFIMSSREGVTRTGREAKMCKISATEAKIHETESNHNVKKQTPLVNRVYETRMKLMHRSVKAACGEMKSMGDYQLLILGAGQDPEYDHYASDGSTVYLVDFPEVAKERQNTISNVFVKVIGADVTHTTELFSLLSTHGCDWSKPTIIVFECVLCYINESSCLSLLKMLSSTFITSVVVSYDPVLKSSCNNIYNFSKHMRDKFTTRGAPLLSSSHSVSHRIDHFIEGHWKYVHSVNLNHAVQMWLSNDPVVDLRESFDEYASLVSIHNHYAMTIASSDDKLYSRLLASLRSKELCTTSLDSLYSETILSLNARITCAESQLESIERVLTRIANSVDNHSIEIRNADNKLSTAVSELYTEAFKEVSAKYDSVRKFVRQNTKALMDIERFFPTCEGCACFVAVVEGVVVGCVGCSRKVDRMELSHLSVTRSFQRKGIGKALIDKVINHTMSLGIKRIDLTVLSDLEAAIHLYSSVGFRTERIDDLGKGCRICSMSVTLS